MKRIGLVLLCSVLVFSLSACKGKPSVSSSDTSSKITEKDIFEYNGTESEYRITESEATELFNNQSNPVASSEDATTSSEDANDPSAPNDIDSESTSSVDSSSEASSVNELDKDGDGWTDDWK